MTASMIDKRMRRIPNFRGVYMRDDMPDRPLYQESGVINLDSIRGPGTHWVCWFKNGNMKIYFDSFGAEPPSELRKYLGPNIKMSTQQVQRLNTNHCGQLCIYVIKQLQDGRDFESVVLDISDGKWEKYLIS